MSLLSALRHQGETEYIRPPEESADTELVVDSIVLRSGSVQRDLRPFIKAGWDRELAAIKRERDEWKAKAMGVEIDLAAIRRDIREILFQITVPSKKESE